jgi:hypothetical protein
VRDPARHVPRLALALLTAACTPPAKPEPLIVALPPTLAAPTATESAAPSAPSPPAAAASAPPATDPSLPPTHPKVACNPGERRFFACDAKAGAATWKIVLCAADFGKPSASLSLVYGAAAHPEDEVRAPISANGTLIRYSRYTRPRVTYLHLELRRGEGLWQLSDESSDEGPTTEWSKDLLIRAPGGGERTLRCISRSGESLMGLEDQIQSVEP